MLPISIKGCHYSYCATDMLNIIRSLYRQYASTLMTSCYYASMPTRNVVAGSKKNNQPMNLMIMQMIQLLQCVLPMRKIRHCSGKLDQHLSLYCDAVKLKLQTGPRLLVLLSVLLDMISKIYWEFWHSFFKNALKSSCNFDPIEIMWWKWYIQIVWNQCHWQCDCIHYDVSLYQRMLTGYFHGVNVAEHKLCGKKKESTQFACQKSIKVN